MRGRSGMCEGPVSGPPLSLDGLVVGVEAGNPKGGTPPYLRFRSGFRMGRSGYSNCGACIYLYLKRRVSA